MADTVERAIEVELAPEEVWELLVDDEERAGWFGGDTHLDVEPGGDGEFTDPDGTRRRAVVGDVEPGRRLSWTWWPDGDPDGASEVRIDLQPTPAGTRVAVTESPLVPSVRASRGTDLFPLEVACLRRASALAAVA